MENYIASSQLPRLPTEVREELEAPIMLAELQRAVGGMKPGKAPGPDGFTLQYYQSLLPTLGPYLVKLFHALSSDTNFPRDTLKAHISIILKEGKDLSSCGSYRPVSLLNVDLKLFTKILATQLAHQLQSIVHLDQVGFIPSREARDNTAKVFSI